MKFTAKEAETALLNKVVRFNKHVEDWEIDFDTGMLGRIKAIQAHGFPVYSLVIDFSEFEDTNIPLMKANYYNKKGVPCETWAQQSNYKEERGTGTNVYVQFVDDRKGKEGELMELPFDIAEDKLQPLVPTMQEMLDALERTLTALKQRNLGKPYACLDEVFAEANHVLGKAKRDIINP